VLRARECAPTPFLSVVFTFGLAIESIKELRGASSRANHGKFVNWVAIMYSQLVKKLIRWE
jgi:hypothetical protein